MPEPGPFPPFDLRTLREVVEQYDISSQNMEPLVSPQGHDNLNLIFRAAGRRYVLRCYRVTPPDEVGFEVDVLRFLASSSFPTPDVLRTSNGATLIQVDGYPAALFEFVEGLPLPEDDQTSGLKVAGVMGDLHSLTQDRAFPERTRTDLNRIEHLNSLCSSDPAIAAKPLLAHFRAELRRLSARFLDVAGQSASLPKTVVHHDMHADNLLVAEDGEIVAVLDFDEAYYGPAVIDLASLLLTWGLDDARDTIDRQRSASLLTRYSRTRHLSAAEVAAMPDAVLLVVAADAAEFLTRGFARDRSLNPEICNSLQRFFRLLEDPSWRDGIQDAPVH